MMDDGDCDRILSSTIPTHIATSWDPKKSDAPPCRGFRWDKREVDALMLGLRKYPADLKSR